MNTSKCRLPTPLPSAASGSCVLKRSMENQTKPKQSKKQNRARRALKVQSPGMQANETQPPFQGAGILVACCSYPWFFMLPIKKDAASSAPQLSALSSQLLTLSCQADAGCAPAVILLSPPLLSLSFLASSCLISSAAAAVYLFL